MTDVVVVGAGLSGLLCALRMRQANLDVKVLEARDRVGGRLLTGHVLGLPVDFGGQWMSAGQGRLAWLAKELDVRTVTQERAGEHVIDLPQRSWWTHVRDGVAQWRAARRIRQLCESPPTHDDSLATYLAQHVTNEAARALLGVHAELVFAREPADLSLLSYLATMRATGGFGARGAEVRFVGGAQSLCLRLATLLGERVVLETPVTGVEQHAASVRVMTKHASHDARRVVIAMPPRMLRDVAIVLPPTVQHVVDHGEVGGVVKCFAAYAAPFWRTRGFSGEAYHPHGDVRATVALDGSGAHLLLAFVVGSVARRWRDRDRDERKHAVLAVLAAQFGEEAVSPLAYIEHDWTREAWSAGCVASMAPNAFVGDWGVTHDRVHFAGTEAARSWPGYMEGAIEAAERVATEVIDSVRAGMR